MVTPLPPTRAALDRALAVAMEGEISSSFNLARRLTGNDADAADALQEAWLRAWTQKDSWRGEGAAGAWLRAIVVRECLRGLRWRAARAWLPFGPGLPELPAPGPGPDPELDAAVARAVVARLPAQQRVVFTLRFDEGWTVPEIAESLELSADTVKTHLTRALARVRAALGVKDVL